MNAMAFQVTGVSINCSTVYSSVDQRKHQGSTSLAFVRGIHRSPVDSSSQGQVTRGMFQFDDVTMMPLLIQYDSRVIFYPAMAHLVDCTLLVEIHRLPIHSYGRNIDELVQERRDSSELASELRLPCTNPSIWRYSISWSQSHRKWTKPMLHVFVGHPGPG